MLAFYRRYGRHAWISILNIDIKCLVTIITKLIASEGLICIFMREIVKFSDIMKHTALVLIFCLSSIIYGQKQSTLIKAGVNFATINSESDVFTSRISFHVGFGIESELSDKFSLTPEVVFSSQGAKTKNGSQNELRLNYINLPIMFRFYPDGGFYFEAGPQAGILVSARQSSDSSYDSNISNIKGQDYGFNLGLGFKSEAIIGINARYYFGLRDINDYEFGEKTKNGVFQISLSFHLN